MDPTHHHRPPLRGYSKILGESLKYRSSRDGRAPRNVPGSDSVLMFGGSGLDSSGSEIFFNDLWSLLGESGLALSDGCARERRRLAERDERTLGFYSTMTPWWCLGEKMTRNHLDDAWAYSISAQTFTQISAPFPVVLAKVTCGNGGEPCSCLGSQERQEVL